ncbi:hypothetical protein LEP3755_19570 [Leptolyngbya sp. NIES-3755]|nr:hypothetical protein LEP3755_19570 [Leptolyngbya sp. NIES-3755]
MPRVTFDTNIFIARKRAKLPDSFYLSVVVLQELVVGADRDTTVKELYRVKKIYEKADRLLVPDAEDWWLAGKVINSMQRGLKSQKGGVTPKLSTDQKHRITHDVLIARTAKRAGVTVITDNLRDFEAIQRFCNVRFVSGDEYFGNES